MRPFGGRMAWRLTTLLRTAGIGGRSDGRVRAAVSLGALVIAALVGSLVLARDPATVEAERYAAYADPEKPVISYLLSDTANVEDFQQEFGLDNGEMEAVFAAVRRENETLAGTFSESEEVVRANRGLSNDRIAEKITASSFDESVRAAVARTKSDVRRILPVDRRSDLGAWVNARWQGEREEFHEAPSAFRTTSTAERGKTFRVFATQYAGYTRYEVALPHRKIKFEGGYRVRIRPDGSSKRAWVEVKEVGPWNTYDNWWDRKKDRDMWKDLPRGLPEAQAAYFDNYNRGRDEYGRKVLNPAGADLTTQFAREVGLDKYENAWVYVHVPWVPR